MFETVLIVLLTLSIPVLSYYVYQKGIKRGQNDFFKLIAAFGYDSKVKAFQELNRHATHGGIAFIGDSITQDYPVHEWFKEKNVYNRGIGGDTTEGLMKRLDVSVFELKPKAVVLLIGTNDGVLLNKSPEEVAFGIKSIISSILAWDETIKVLLQSIYPVNPEVDPKTVGIRTNAKIQETNAMLKTFSEVTYVDVYSHLIDEKGLLSKELTHDGLHLNMKGYRIVTERLSKWL